MSIPCLVTRDLNRYQRSVHTQDAYDQEYGTRAYQAEQAMLANDTELAKLFNEDLVEQFNSTQAARAIRELLKGNPKPMAEIFQTTLDYVVDLEVKQEMEGL